MDFVIAMRKFAAFIPIVAVNIIASANQKAGREMFAIAPSFAIGVFDLFEIDNSGIERGFRDAMLLDKPIKLRCASERGKPGDRRQREASGEGAARDIWA
ncbi:MAG: hypothetical protein WBQ53_17970, partial [Methylocystis sp.]